MENDRLLVHYDGECAFCRACIAWLSRRSDASFQFEPFPEGTHPDGLQTVGGSGGIATHELAVAECFSRLDGKYRWIGKIISFPLARPLFHLLYKIVAANRSLFSRWIFPSHGKCSCDHKAKSSR